MPFLLTPILDRMQALYQMPRNPERFNQYLLLLQGQSGEDMELPISSYNPMAKEVAVEKLNQLIEWKAEAIATEAIELINQELGSTDLPTLQVVLNLIDDVEGSWSNRFTTDYSSKFELKALVNRHFCTPIFWTSEDLNPDMIRERIRAYMYRSLFWISQKSPSNLQDFLDQEMFVQKKLESKAMLLNADELELVSAFAKAYATSDNYSDIFNFFYGDAAAETIAYPKAGLPDRAGFRYAHHLSRLSP